MNDDVVTWRAPSDDGGSSITGYEVRFFNSGGHNSAAIRATTEEWYRPSEAQLPSQRPVYVQVKFYAVQHHTCS